jgi:hypothetical protein
LTKHSKISYIKSGIRIVGFGFLPFGPVCLFVGAGLLIVAELFGIAEEWGATY